MSGYKEMTFWCDQDARRNNEDTVVCWFYLQISGQFITQQANFEI